jgi:hypothetical protein
VLGLEHGVVTVLVIFWGWMVEGGGSRIGLREGSRVGGRGVYDGVVLL